MKVKFLGTSAEDVTGSMNLVTFKNGYTVLVDCGLYQSNNPKKDYEINNANFPFKVKDIDLVLLTHLHADHLGRVPLLYKRGYKGKVGVVKGSLPLMKDMLDDSCHIVTKTAEYLSKKDETLPIYEQEDVDTTIQNTIEYDFFNEIKIGDISFKFIPNQHIKYSAQIIFHEKHDKLVISGDLGNIAHDPLYCEEFSPIRNCNIYVGECTYGSRNRVIGATREQELEEIREIIQTCNGTILIPSFSLHRTQVMAKTLLDMDLNCKIFIDSPLSRKICEKYDMDDVLDNKQIRVVEDWRESQDLMDSGHKKVVLASAGMLSAGRSTSWLKSIVSNPINQLIFVGYCSEGTIGRVMQQSPLEAKIQANTYEVKCGIHTFSTFSSHMQREDLLDYYSSINCNQLILTHGSTLAKQQLKEDLEKIYSQLCKSTKVICSERNLEIEI